MTITDMSRADNFMSRLLFIDQRSLHAAAAAEIAQTRRAENALTISLLFSGVRCILQYVVLPFFLPIFGVAADATVPILLLINLIAMVSIFLSLRRFLDNRLQASLALSHGGDRGADTLDRLHRL